MTKENAYGPCPLDDCESMKVFGYCEDKCQKCAEWRGRKIQRIEDENEMAVMRAGERSRIQEALHKREREIVEWLDRDGIPVTTRRRFLKWLGKE